MDGGEKVLGELVTSGCDPAEVLDRAEHALDGVSIAIHKGREAVFPAPVGLGRDVGRGSHVLDLAVDGIAVIAFVAVQDRRFRHVLQQGLGSRAVGYLAAGQQEGCRAAEAIGQSMDLGGPPATRAANGLLEFPLLRLRRNDAP